MRVRVYTYVYTRMPLLSDKSDYICTCAYTTDGQRLMESPREFLGLRSQGTLNVKCGRLAIHAR